ncbi:HlyC/CorC family transporter [Actinoalloteichus sp. AHMU CJ021]|uniref:Hemolysin, contains CBS domains n=1 Tax=Actinoalloteichus caeruleus DSM 43889 TaxID=1120930 RepID=A0ABT1JP00_ACTCY|nr:hemolysin family protein [Actinoalloteichus caeruleus]AUS80060.1 HlyC/CorC family transporter [Actinoalloteichus sp. AHMU CJ021]MCP2334250.1 Hemolysin, contains CBS domains [Actinoalloteichus caeruleus DSM 43889]
MSSLPVFLPVAILLVALAGVFAAADSAISTVSRARVEEMVRAGRNGASRLAAVVADRPRHINLLVLLRLGCELTATVLVTVVVVEAFDPDWLAVLIAGLVMLVVSYALIGVGPRTIGRQHPYGVGCLLAGPVWLLARVLSPLSRLLILVGNAITPGRGFREGPFSSEVELRELVDMAEQRGVVAAGESQMIHSIFDLGGTVAREVMVPRTEIVWIEQHKTVRQALALCLRTGYTRVPVIGESVDDIVGVVNLKDLVRHAVEASGPAALDRTSGTHTPVSDLMRPVALVPDSKRLVDLLKEMQISRNHLAVAVDEYGGTAGLLTIEDILEEIVGEITDEHDVGERPPVEMLPDGTARVSARLPLDDLAELFDLELEEHDVDTAGGLLAHRLGRVPLPGAEADIDGLWLRAEGGKDNRGRIRITTLLARRTGPARRRPTSAVDTEPAEAEAAQRAIADSHDQEGSAARG